MRSALDSRQLANWQLANRQPDSRQLDTQQLYGRQRGHLWLLALVACAVLQGCSPDRSEIPSTGSAVPQILIAATSSDMAGVNELISAHDRFTQDVVDAQFLRLFEEQPDFESGPPTMAPQLAASYEWEEPGSDGIPSLLVRLDPRARWSDGIAISADDVRWTWEAQSSDGVAWPYAEAKESITDVEIVDATTVRFHLTHRYLSQLQDINLGVILPKHVWSGLPFDEWRQRPEWFLDHLVVSGPFSLARWERDSEVVLERNETYSLGEPAKLERVVFRILPEKASQVAGLLSGDLHFIERVPPADAARIDSSPDAELVRYWTRQYDFLCWNVENPLFRDAEVRRALTLAIDREALVETLWHGYARVSKSPIIASVWAHHRELEAHPYDPQRARETLAAHGWNDSDGDGVLDRGGEEFRFELLTNGDSRARSDAATMVQEQLAQVGVAVETRAIDFLTATERTLAHEFDAAISGWLIDTSLDLSYAFHSEWIAPGYNLGSYSDPALDEKLDAAGRTLDPEEFRRLLLEIQEILHTGQPYTQLWEPMGLNGAHRDLQGFQSNAQTSYFDLDSWWIDGTVM